MRDTQIDAAQALDRFFAVVRDEASTNSRFAARLVQAIGNTVVFRGSDARNALDPVQVAMQGREEFCRTFLSFSPAELKVLAKDFNLVTRSDLRGKTRAAQIVGVMWKGACGKLHDLGRSR